MEIFPSIVVIGIILAIGLGGAALALSIQTARNVLFLYETTKRLQQILDEEDDFELIIEGEHVRVTCADEDDGDDDDDDGDDDEELRKKIRILLNGDETDDDIK